MFDLQLCSLLLFVLCQWHKRVNGTTFLRKWPAPKFEWLAFFFQSHRLHCHL